MVFWGKLKEKIKNLLAELLIRTLLFGKIRDILFEKKDVKKILVLAYTGLGNFILYTPALISLKNYMPEAKLSLLSIKERGCREVLSGSDLFYDYWVISTNEIFFNKMIMAYRLRKEKYDLVISEFHNNFLFLVFFTVFCNAKYRLGHVSSPDFKNKWSFIYNLPVRMKKDQHEIDRYLELIYSLGANKKQITRETLFSVNRNDIEFADNLMKKYNIEKNCKIVSMQIGSTSDQNWKRWGFEKYKALSNKILETPNTVLIFNGSPEERSMAEEIASEIRGKAIVASGETSITQAAAILLKSDVLICNDSGLMHVAAAVGTPVVAIYGPTDYKRTAPTGKLGVIVRKNLECSPCYKINNSDKVNNCPYGYECLNGISVEKVYKIVMKTLANMGR